jgi:hypothetical protein
MAVGMDDAAKRRVRAGRLLLKGKAPAEVARVVGSRGRRCIAGSACCGSAASTGCGL